jgi:hypothetical protein
MILAIVNRIGLNRAKDEREKYLEKTSECTFVPDTKKPSGPFNYQTQSEYETMDDANKKGLDSYL